MNPASQVPIRIIMPDGAPKIIRKEQLPDQRQIVVVPIRAFKDRRLTPGLFRALGIMCSYSNRAGLLWAGLERMGQDLGISQQAMQVHAKKLEGLGYVRTVYRGFAGERAATRQIIFNQELSTMQIAKKTEAPAPYMVQKEQKKQRKAAKKSSKTTDNAQEVVETPMQDVHDVMRLKNKVSSKIWQLAIARAGTDNDYDKLKAAIDKLLR